MTTDDLWGLNTLRDDAPSPLLLRPTQVEVFEVGERVWMQNPFFRDGTKLRAGPRMEDPFLETQ